MINVLKRTGQKAPLAVFALLLLSCPFTAGADAAREQAKLDAACETAREAKLAPLRQQHVDECVQKGQRPDRASCEAFYADWGGQSGNRAPLFYDLPECEKAFEHRQNNRSR